MRNKAMQRKLVDGEALDVACILSPDHVDNPVGDTGSAVVYRIGVFQEGKDYCHAPTEEWIRSIGMRKSDGAIFASTDAMFYEHPLYECVWLR